MELNFDDAMYDFKTMFPDLDLDIIESVLRSNKGAVHATIDQLLNMVHAEDATDSKNYVTPSKSRKELLATEASDQSSSHTNAVHFDRTSKIQHSSQVLKKWKPAILLPLPRDFLRVTTHSKKMDILSPHHLTEKLSENALAREAVGECDVELAQYLKDERIALFLQNDEFLRELRSNQDFMSALQKEDEKYDGWEDENDAIPTNFREYGDSSYRFSGKNTAAPFFTLDDATFKERISNMGKVSRKKFAQVAKVFSRGKKSATNTLNAVSNQGMAASKDFFMAKETLIDDTDDDRVRSSSESVGRSFSTPRKL